MNLRPSGYEPDELPDCSTPHRRAEHCTDAGDVCKRVLEDVSGKGLLAQCEQGSRHHAQAKGKQRVDAEHGAHER